MTPDDYADSEIEGLAVSSDSDNARVLQRYSQWLCRFAYLPATGEAGGFTSFDPVRNIRIRTVHFQGFPYMRSPGHAGAVIPLVAGLEGVQNVVEGESQGAGDAGRAPCAR
jgi:hypothetical protein